MNTLKNYCTFLKGYFSMESGDTAIHSTGSDSNFKIKEVSETAKAARVKKDNQRILKLLDSLTRNDLFRSGPEEPFPAMTYDTEKEAGFQELPELYLEQEEMLLAHMHLYTDEVKVASRLACEISNYFHTLHSQRISKVLSNEGQSTAGERTPNHFVHALLENTMQIIFDHAPDGVILIDEQSKISKWNSRAEHLFGWKAEEVIGKPIYDLIIPEGMRQAHKAGMNRFMETGAGPMLNKTVEVEALNREGKLFHVSLSISPTLIGGKTCFISFIRDMTDYKQAQEQLRKKTIELERSNKELEQFAYVASHDLQEPLRMITNYVQLLATRYKDKLDGDANDFIGFAVDGSNRMRNLIYSLLEYSRVNREKPPEWMNTNEIVLEVLHDLQTPINENAVQIHVSKLPDIFGDAVLISQLFQNLIANAIKFRGPKSPEISISALVNGNELQFMIRDNGIGIKEAYKERIFQIFQRLHNREQYPGTGIGLAICKKIVDKHSGRIWVESREGNGAVFIFTLADDKYRETNLNSENHE